MSDHSKLPKSAGIYKLTCNANDKIYIGKSVNIRRRVYDHAHCRKRGKCGTYLKNAIIKYGWAAFSVEVLELVENFNASEDNISLLEKESYYIELFESYNKDKGYNICKFSNDSAGVPKSQEHIEKIRKGNIGKKRSDETKRRMSIAKLGNTNMLGKKHSEDTKAKMKKSKSEEIKGKKRKPMSEETKEKIRQKNIGRVVPEERKERIRQSSLGKPKSEEHKENMRKSKKKL